jgi:hypothetical protein
VTPNPVEAKPSKQKEDKVDHEKEIYRLFSKRLLQIPKKNENYLIDEVTDTSKSSRESLSIKSLVERKKTFKLVPAGESTEGDDSILNNMLLKVSALLNAAILDAKAPLPKEKEFVSHISTAL